MTTLRLYNTLSREKEDFDPLDKDNVRLYACGPTVYNYAHVGNARAAVVFDVLYRVLRQLYGANHVTYARNITDVDDKIIDAAQKTGRPISEITQHFEQIYNADMAALGCLPPTVTPRATEHMPQMIAMVEKLLAHGHAYAKDGHVLFHVPSMPDYGRLSRKNQDELIAGARVDVAPYKKDPSDFVLWKPARDNEPGWDSPWGRGRPGWHLECSAMTETHLGETFDIHAGGLDLIFPHHENEIAQSTCAHGGKVMARYWVHNGFLTMGDEKMSKSLGNVVYAHDLLKHWPGEVIRLALLSAHYRQPLSFTEDVLQQSKNALDSGYRVLMDSPLPDPTGSNETDTLDLLLDDLNTPAAFRHLQPLLSGNQATQNRAQAALLARLLGLFQQKPADWFAWKPAGASVDEAHVQSLIDARTAAKKARNFAEADRLRDELTTLGIALEDSPRGTTWRYVG